MAGSGLPAHRGGDEVSREDVEAALEVRRELGPSYDAALVDSFAERVERAVAGRAGAAVEDRRRAEQLALGDRQRQLALGIVSLGASIPITIPLAVTDHLPAVLVSWLGITAINVAHAAAIRGRRG